MGYKKPEMATSNFLDPRTTPFVEPRSRGELPHLYKDGGSYFITFRLWDAVIPGAGETPAPQQNTIKDNNCGAAVPAAPRQLTFEQVAVTNDPPIQIGSCVLGKPAIADVVQKALLHFNTHRYELAAWCVMPNHVHVVVTPLLEFSLSSILHSWKSFTSHQINRLLKRTGTWWERESFDHLIRSIADFDRFIDYVEYNPVVAGLCQHPADWLSSSAHIRQT